MSQNRRALQSKGSIESEQKHWVSNRSRIWWDQQKRVKRLQERVRYQESEIRCEGQAKRREERAWREWRGPVPQLRALSIVFLQGQRRKEPRPNHHLHQPQSRSSSSSLSSLYLSLLAWLNLPPVLFIFCLLTTYQFFFLHPYSSLINRLPGSSPPSTDGSSSSPPLSNTNQHAYNLCTSDSRWVCIY